MDGIYSSYYSNLSFSFHLKYFFLFSHRDLDTFWPFVKLVSFIKAVVFSWYTLTHSISSNNHGENVSSCRSFLCIFLHKMPLSYSFQIFFHLLSLRLIIYNVSVIVSLSSYYRLKLTRWGVSDRSRYQSFSSSFVQQCFIRRSHYSLTFSSISYYYSP